MSDLDAVEDSEHIEGVVDTENLYNFLSRPDARQIMLVEACHSTNDKIMDLQAQLARNNQAVRKLQRELELLRANLRGALNE